MTKKQITYSEAIKEIEKIVDQIENDQHGIDELTEKVKTVTALVSFCKEKLRQTEEDLNNIMKQTEEKKGKN